MTTYPYKDVVILTVLDSKQDEMETAVFLLCHCFFSLENLLLSRVS